MEVLFTERFKKEFARLPASTQEKFEFHASLRNHALQGNLVGMRAFSVTLKIRVVYCLLKPDLAKLITVGPHDHVYR